MIKHLTRKELDVQKYDKCISNAVNTRIYAYSWYLDIVCDNWDVLVKGDYQVVMPLPKRRKYFINYIYLPPWVQQLGMFSSDNIDELMIADFMKSIPRKFKLVDIFLNSENNFSSKHLSVRNNYILSLNESYKVIKKQFSKGRKSNIKQTENLNLILIDNSSPDKIIQLFKQNKGIELHRKTSDYNILSKLINSALQLNLAKSYAVTNSKKELIGGAFFLKDKHRITYLFSAINDEGREKQVMSFLINHVIKYNTESNYIFDFEGSMIKELASFFKSFGALRESYFHYKKYNI